MLGGGGEEGMKPGGRCISGVGGKEEIEKKWSGALVERVTEVGTSDKIPTKIPTSSMCSEVLTSLGMFERLGP